jgi:hypothetical protein
MDAVVVDLEDSEAVRLRELSERVGVPAAVLARRAVTAMLRDEAYEFFGAGESDELRGDRVDDLLEDGFAAGA